MRAAVALAAALSLVKAATALAPPLFVLWLIDWGLAGGSLADLAVAFGATAAAMAIMATVEYLRGRALARRLSEVDAERPGAPATTGAEAALTAPLDVLAAPVLLAAIFWLSPGLGLFALMAFGLTLGAGLLGLATLADMERRMRAARRRTLTRSLADDQADDWRRSVPPGAQSIRAIRLIGADRVGGYLASVCGLRRGFEVAAFAIGGALVIAQGVTLGVAAACALLLRAALEPIERMMAQGPALHRASAVVLAVLLAVRLAVLGSRR